MPQAPLDVLTMGRSGVDLYPQQHGVSLDEVSTFAKFLGGSATNVAVGAARLGHASGVITRIGPDPFGRFVRAEIERFGVDATHVLPVAGRDDLPTPVTFCEIFPPDNFPLYFYRSPTAPDLQIEPGELDHEVIAAAGIFWATLTGLCQEPSRSAHHTAWAVRSRRPGHWTVLDLDYRAMFWRDAAAAHHEVQAALPYLDVVVGNLTECSVAVTGSEHSGLAAPALARAILDRGVQMAVVKLGPDGVYAATATDEVTSGPVPVHVVNGLGAGDAFGAALCHGLLAGSPLGPAIHRANAAGAYVAGQLACADAMPTLEQIERFGETR